MQGIAIAIAWPDFWGKQPGSWYDGPMRWLGSSKNFHYQVGHASVVLVNITNGLCQYFDCGRYHAPYQHGRIRDAATDDDLTIKTMATLVDGEITNMEEILTEVQHNESCFGMGALHASVCQIDFDKSHAEAKRMQSRGVVPFGPFVVQGTNCCRFVRSVLLAGARPGSARLKLRFLWFLKPTPLWIVQLLNKRYIIKPVGTDRAGKHHSLNVYNRSNVGGTLPPPERPGHLPACSQWLSGEVAGSWFSLEVRGTEYIVEKYSPEGRREGGGAFTVVQSGYFDPQKEYVFDHISHCSEVTLKQEGGKVKLKRVD